MTLPLDEFAGRIAPELRSGPLYVVEADEPDLPPEYRLYGTRGLYAPFLDVALAGWLRSRDRWQGRGPLILINVEALRDEADQDAGGDRDLADALCRGRTVAVLTHELAHVLELGIDRREFPLWDEASEAAATTIRRWALDDYTPPAEPWHGHGGDWLRLLAHVTYRAERLIGERLPEPWLIGGANFGLSAYGCYSFALGDEPERLANLSFDEIKAEAPPAEFISLWRSDIQAWHKALDEPGPEAAKAVADGMALFSRS